MRLKAAISLLFLLTVITTASAYFAGGQSNMASSTNGQDEAFEARRQNFKSGREMLLDKGVTFEPQELLRDQRSKVVKDALDAMPEMHQSRYETAPLKGAYLADTLYLPEKVQVDGHTVIVANYVVFEGKNPIIKGPYDVTVIPSKPIAVLGMSLAEALHRKGVLLNVGMGAKRILPSFALIQDLKVKSARVTIDTTGPKPQTGRPPIHKSVVNLHVTSWSGFRPVFFQNQDTTGVTGSIGAPGTPGAPGNAGESPAKADNGSCAASFNGSGGFFGGDGGTGAGGGTGGQGSPGGNAGAINFMVQDGDLNQYSFKADGGTGGQGGEGGIGGMGGAGGRGGDGGDGVACECAVGDGGGAGHGGGGALGGTGGSGGQGGTGGNGGTITVSLPAGSPGATTSNFGGSGGRGGSGGSGGIGGNPGSAGIGGRGASACGNTGLNGDSNFGGGTGASGASGNAGPNGTDGLPGPAPSITRRSAPVAGGGPIDPCLNGAAAPGPVGDFGTGGGGGGGGNAPDCSPIIVDLTGDGFFLTDAAHGVTFDIANNGGSIHMAWTANSNNAFLALDRNGSGTITNGAELFGNFTSQPVSPHPNGFAALAVYDDPANGGNGDGVIDARDKIFSALRLWLDANHDGISQPEELHTLPELGIYSISLNYELSERKDQYGNLFRYRARVNQGLHGASDVGKTAYDVFLVAQ